MERGSSLPGQERMSENDVEAIDHLRDAYARLTKELGKVIVGQQRHDRAAGDLSFRAGTAC